MRQILEAYWTTDPLTDSEVVEPKRRLQRSGWTLMETHTITAEGSVLWILFGRNGENVLRSESPNPASAWEGAIAQAAACGMLAGWPRPRI